MADNAEPAQTIPLAVSFWSTLFADVILFEYLAKMRY